jgi:hypothetical protein
MTGSPLERAIGRASERRKAAFERCELCSAPVPDEHRHILDEQSGQLVCACRPCSLLFERDAAGAGHYRLIPTVRTQLDDVPADLLNVPVGLAFFVRQDDGRVLAHYPSPLGTTEHEVEATIWRELEQQVPAALALRPRVEALLVRTTGGRDRGQQWILPLDDCYRLVAVIRMHWSGMSGGPTVWREVARFFADLEGSTSGARRTSRGRIMESITSRESAASSGSS